MNSYATSSYRRDLLQIKDSLNMFYTWTFLIVFKQIDYKHYYNFVTQILYLIKQKLSEFTTNKEGLVTYCRNVRDWKLNDGIMMIMGLVYLRFHEVVITPHRFFFCYFLLPFSKKFLFLLFLITMFDIVSFSPYM